MQLLTRSEVKKKKSKSKSIITDVCNILLSPQIVNGALMLLLLSWLAGSYLPCRWYTKMCYCFIFIFSCLQLFCVYRVACLLFNDIKGFSVLGPLTVLNMLVTHESECLPPIRGISEFNCDPIFKLWYKINGNKKMQFS